jgi:aminopeptidase N
VTAPAPRRRRLSLALVAATLLGVAGCTADSPDPSDLSPDPTSAGERFAGLDVEKGRSQVVPDPVYGDYGNASLDVLAYGLDLAWDPEAEELRGVATILIRAVADVTAITLDFARQYTVDSATVDGTAVTPQWDGDDLRVAHALDADERATLVVSYRGRPAPVAMPSQRGDFAEGLGLRVTRDGELWTMQEPYGASTWYPANDMPSDEAVYDIRVTVPANLSAVASGTFLGVTPVRTSLVWPAGAGADRTFHWRSTDPVATYLTTLAIAEYTMLADESEDGVPLTYWLRTGEDEWYAPVLRRSPELLAWLSERFGPYPFPSGGVVLVESTSAMETQQMITFGGDLGRPGDLDSIAEVLLHEYAHHWFGNAVTPTDWTGLWLNEGWAMYCELLWVIDEGLASEAAVLSWARSIDAQSRAAAGPPGRFDPDHFAESNVYFGPALMLHAIHEQLGDEAFFALGRDWVQQRRHTQVDRTEFTAFVNEHTGQDFTALIDEWLDSPTTPAR